MIQKKHLILIAIMCLIATRFPRPRPTNAAPSAPAAPSTATVSCNAAAISGQINHDLAVHLTIENVSDLYGLDIRTEFDPADLQVVDSENALVGIQISLLDSFLKPNFVLRNTADNTAGTIAYAATQMNPTPPATGSGSVATITFRPQKTGQTELKFIYTLLASPVGTAIAHETINCAITISNDGPTCPATSAVWVDDAYGPELENDGHNWGCDAFSTIQSGINAVEPNGTVFVASGTYPEAISAENPITLHGATTPLPTLNAGSATAVTITNSAVTIRGFTLISSSTGFDLSNATLTAYANNIQAPLNVWVQDGNSSTEAHHNWWGSATTPPTALDSQFWQTRLGAPIKQWAEGTNTTSLPDSNGGLFELYGGTGTAVLINHGRADSAANAPFGNSFAGSATGTCSDFVDAFVLDATGSWQFNLPVDTPATHTGCDAVLQSKASFTIPTGTDYTTACQPADNPACWQRLAEDKVTIDGEHWHIAGLASAELNHTSFVAGAPDNPVDPPSYSLQIPVIFTPSTNQPEQQQGVERQ